MENSLNKLMMMMTESSKAQTEESDPEESSWTFYIQDFHNTAINNDFVGFSSSSSLLPNNNESASLLSDAASSASKKPNNYYNKINDKANFIISLDKNKCTDKAMTSFRKRRVIQGAMDEDLQDTASSPINSPKISYMNELLMKQKEIAGAFFAQVMKRGDTAGALVRGEEDDNMTELKKRGLCLVPISSLANYFGLYCLGKEGKPLTLYSRLDS